MIRYRHNIDCLGTETLHDLREALTILYQLPEASPISFAKIAGIHGNPSPSWCLHGYPGFLTWHRAYMLMFERALQTLNPSLTLPYWDWSSRDTTGVPAACASATYVNRAGDTVPNPLYAGPLPSGSYTNRRADIDTTSFGDSATGAQDALTETGFDDFQSAINGPHGSVHGRVSGHMGSVPEAGFDPIFYLHHANVDRLWAIWQSKNTTALPNDEAILPLDPFDMPCTSKRYVGADMQSTTALDYAYRSYCLLVRFPFELFERHPFKIQPWMRDRLQTAHLVVRISEMPRETFELRAFVGDERVSARSALGEHPDLAGSVGVFGMGTMKMAARGSRFDLRLDITEAMRRAVRHCKEPAVTLVAIDSEGKILRSDQVDLDEVELLVS